MKNTANESLKKYDQGTGFQFNLHFIILCLCGQLCWNVENQWFNTFLYRKITTNVDFVTAMVILSATLTCISTFLFGAISDRSGNRKKFVGWGYILWGISTMAVGLTEFVVQPGIQRTIVLAATLVVLLDGVMSFIGSIAYDGSFNAWTNDHTTTKNKGFVGFIYGVMPVIATILGTVVGGMIIGDDVNYTRLFMVISIFVTVVGILSLIFIKDSSNLKPYKDGSLWHQATTPFRLKEIKKLPNFKEMILACLVICVYFISFNFYFVHLGNWALFTLGFQHEMDFGIIEGVSMAIGIVTALPVSKLIDKDKIPLVCLIGLIISIIGLLMVYFFVNSSTIDNTNIFSPKNILLFVACFFFGTGDILMTEACMIWVRGLFPDKYNGQFEGIRCIFFVWIPMLIGTIVAQIVIKNYNAWAGIPQQIGANGEAIDNPPAFLFLIAAVVCVIALVPLFFANKEYAKRIKAKNEALARGVIDRNLFDAIPEEK